MIRSLTLAASLLIAAPAVAQEMGSFIVAADDGYGIDSCMIDDESADSCGAAIARGWCVANGYKQAVSFRRAVETDVTGTSGLVKLVAARADAASIVITCSR
jgi:hypothetical protein